MNPIRVHPCASVVLSWVNGYCLCFCTSLVLSALPEIPALEKRVAVTATPLVIEAGGEWSTPVRVPPFRADQAAVLFLRQRLDVPGGGGCNFVLQILLDGRALTEHPFRPRLLNKPPYFDPPGTDFHFVWHRPGEKAWMTVFGNDFESDWGGTGQDFDFLIDLSGLVSSNTTVTLTVKHRMPLMPKWLKRDRAPLLIDPLLVGVLPKETVRRLREQACGDRSPRNIRVRAELPADAISAAPPYELAWADLSKIRPPQVTFGKLDGWSMEVFGEGDFALSVSTSRRFRQPQVAEFSYRTGKAAVTALLKPPRPIPLPSPLDAANLWVCSDHDRTKEPHLRFTALLRDASGLEILLELGEARNSYWQLLHGVLDRKSLTQARLPLHFAGLIIDNCRVEEERHCYLESIAFYQQDRRPETRLLRPKRPAFPIHDDGLLPSAPAGVVNRVRALAGGAEFAAESPRGTLVYRWVDGVVSARWADGPWFHPIEGAAVQTEQPFPASPGFVHLTDGILEARFDSSPPTTVRVQVRGNTLVLDWACTAPSPPGLDYGVIAGLPGAKPVVVPYLLFNRGEQSIACGRNVFVSVFPDLYHSDFSWVDTTAGKLDDGRLRLLKGTRYDPLTDGVRNLLRERMLVSVSPEFADVLPNVPNPPSPNREALAPFAFVMASHPWPNLWRTAKRYGIDHLIVNDFAGFFVAAYPEGFAGRWQPHPSLSVAQIQTFRELIRGLDYRFGMYQDTREYFPLNQWWDEDKVALTSTGDFVDAWYGNLHTKPNHMAEMIRRSGEHVAELYPPEFVYLDVHTNLGPKAVDYEAGVTLAGMARGTVVGNGDSIVEARKWYGATVSEGIFRWLYAGLSDMDYAQINVRSGPPLVDFDLLKLHPLQFGTMMGWGPSNYLSRDEVTDLSRSPALTPNPGFYKYVGTSLAHGHMLLLGYGYIPPLQLFIRYVALMQGLQRHYLLAEAAKILYHDGDRFLPTSEALRQDANATRRIRIRYKSGMTITVNLDAETAWEVEQAGRSWQLPPYGWVIDGPGDILAYSALRDGVRVDYSRCPEYIYLGSGHLCRREGALEVEGAVWLKREAEGWRLIPCGHLGNWERFPAEGWPERMKDFRLKDCPPDRGCKVLIVDLDMLPGAPTAVAGLTESGVRKAARTTTQPDGRTRIETSVDTPFYLLR